MPGAWGQLAATWPPCRLAGVGRWPTAAVQIVAAEQPLAGAGQQLGLLEVIAPQPLEQQLAQQLPLQLEAVAVCY